MTDLPTDRLADAIDQAKAALALDPTPANLSAQTRALKLFPGMDRTNAEVALYAAWPRNGGASPFLELFAKAWPEDQPKARRAPGQARKAKEALNGHPTTLHPAGWTSRLQVSASGGLKASDYNASLAIEHAPELAGKIAWDIRQQAFIALGDSPAGPQGRWSDSHTARLAIWLQGIQLPVTVKHVETALRGTIQSNGIDPLADYLNGLTWDGQQRIGTWLTDYCSAEPSNANSIMGSLFKIQCVARALQPGCQADAMLVLEGDQGRRKTALIRAMGAEWASESLPDFHSKDAQQIAGMSWIIEVSELAAITKSQLESVKAFITRRTDTYRAPYARHPQAHKRWSCLIGNYNPDGTGVLQDSTGARRFWVVAVGQIDVDAYQRDRDQLWAEAVACYRHGDHWWPSNEELPYIAAQQEMRTDDEPWLEIIAHHINEVTINGARRCEAGGTVTTTKIAIDAIGLTPKDVGRREQMRIAKCLNKLGFMRDKTGPAEARTNCFRRK